MNRRVKAIRKKEHLNQAAFGERLGVTATAISKIESGDRGLTEQMILAICREFKVNEEWLRTGEGGEEAMYEESDDTNISAVATEFGLDEMSRIILASYVQMDSPRRIVFNNFVREMANAVMQQNIENARRGVNEMIAASNVTGTVKNNMWGKVASIFVDAFPYIGSGNIDDEKALAMIVANESKESAILHAKLDEELAKEKKAESQAYFAKKSDAG